jgi:hypothetical protein
LNLKALVKVLGSVKFKRFNFFFGTLLKSIIMLYTNTEKSHSKSNTFFKGKKEYSKLVFSKGKIFIFNIDENFGNGMETTFFPEK